MPTLRPYQEDAIARLRARMIQGARRAVLVIPTGGGKTVIAAEMARQTVENNRRVLFLAHRSELIDQACATLARVGLTVGARCATASTPPNPFAPVQVASVQTLLARNERPPADLIIFDECHHAAPAAEQWSALLDSYASAYVVGLTATPERGDGCGLRGCFDAIVVGTSVRQLTEQGHLVPCEIIRPNKPLGKDEIAQSPVDAYMQHAPGRPTIMFTRGVQMAEDYASEFESRGIVARSISAETPWAERRLYIDAFRRGKIQVLVNVYVLTEGFDAPETSCCILARGCGSAGMYLQMVGRILRPAPGKRDALLLDLRGVSHDHGKPEDEREYSLDGRGISLKGSACFCPVCGAVREPGEPCASCGWTPKSDEGIKPDKVTGDPLVKYAEIRKDDDDKKAERLSRWIRTGIAQKYKPGWAYAKYSAVYGAAATPHVRAMAARLSRGVA